VRWTFVRGGVFRTVMRASDGTEYPTRGVLSRGRRTGADRIHRRASIRVGKRIPMRFSPGISTFESCLAAGRNTPRAALHWTAANCVKQREDGFHQGWRARASTVCGATVMNS